MPARHLILGRRGEDLAAEHLEKLGYTVLDRNWTSGKLEIDLVCKHDDTLVFVEVKTRTQGPMSLPAYGLTPAKQRKIVRAAALYLSRKNLWESPCRFDFTAVTDHGGTIEIEHIPDAFDASGM